MAKTLDVSIYEQELTWTPGKRHYRVMRDDRKQIFERHMTDFDSREDAVTAIAGEFRRNNLGPVNVRFHGINCTPTETLLNT